MNKDINHTLMALVPILRMNGEKITSIEAVEDWYKAGDQEYMKEVAEITYENGYHVYADIGCDSNLTAVYDVVAVIQELKPRSSAIERIVRGIYELPPTEPQPKVVDYGTAAMRINHSSAYSIFAVIQIIDLVRRCGLAFCEDVTDTSDETLEELKEMTLERRIRARQTYPWSK